RGRRQLNICRWDPGNRSLDPVYWIRGGTNGKFRVVEKRYVQSCHANADHMAGTRFVSHFHPTPHWREWKVTRERAYMLNFLARTLLTAALVAIAAPAFGQPAQTGTISGE